MSVIFGFFKTLFSSIGEFYRFLHVRESELEEVSEKHNVW
jgi:hypothetical protein